MTTVLAAQRPDAPTDVITVVTGDTVTFTWSLASTGGSPITGYRIFIGQSDSLTFTQDLTNCNGASSSIIMSRSCLVPID